MSLAYRGGSKQFGNVLITSESDVIALLQAFVRDKFKRGKWIAEKLNDDHRYIIKFDDFKWEKSVHDSTKICEGCFMYPADEHPVQTIWENKFRIYSNDEGVLVRVSSWYGTTLESWKQKERRNELW